MNRLSHTVRALSPDCKEAVRLQSDALERPLSFPQRMGLRIHLLLCKWCRRYGKHIAFLRIVARDCDHVHEPVQALPPAARERIIRSIKSARN